jgi:hypothetical protein
VPRGVYRLALLGPHFVAYSQCYRIEYTLRAERRSWLLVSTQTTPKAELAHTRPVYRLFEIRRRKGHHNIPEDIELSWHEQPTNTMEDPDEMQGPRYRILRHQVHQRYVCILFRVNEKCNVALISRNYLQKYNDLHCLSQEFLGTSY